MDIDKQTFLAMDGETEHMDVYACLRSISICCYVVSHNCHDKLERVKQKKEASVANGFLSLVLFTALIAI